jgi:hypothetical protein
VILDRKGLEACDVTLASCRIRIVRGHREQPRDCGTMALKLDRLSRNLAIIATLMDPRFRHSSDAYCQ